MAKNGKKRACFELKNRAVDQPQISDVMALTEEMLLPWYELTKKHKKPYRNWFWRKNIKPLLLGRLDTSSSNRPRKAAFVLQGARTLCRYSHCRVSCRETGKLRQESVKLHMRSSRSDYSLLSFKAWTCPVIQPFSLDEETSLRFYSSVTV